MNEEIWHLLISPIGQILLSEYFRMPKKYDENFIKDSYIFYMSLESNTKYDLGYFNFNPFTNFIKFKEFILKNEKIPIEIKTNLIKIIFNYIQIKMRCSKNE